jgi:hypothetical protein
MTALALSFRGWRENTAKWCGCGLIIGAAGGSGMVQVPAGCGKLEGPKEGDDGETTAQSGLLQRTEDRK